MSNEHSNQDQAPGQNKEYDIIVNGRPKTFNGKKISYEEVVILAYGEDAFNDDRFEYTVTYSKGHQDNLKGSLVRGESVRVKDGMIFNVKRTIRS